MFETFQQFRESFMQLLVKTIVLDSERKSAWESTINMIFHIIFNNLDENAVN